ncbi:YoaK family protein [Luteimonas fraxinea]|uniref:DUF1275 domain-containing protein n=1 Tax=Luteimonas fraxinea TaxID=2901869 RepID=A0ABS8U6J5_9GAMM|nr:YoaK family protein [Luteimonas fraxinea]MCD9095393.1 DUF1275 domain-containing protein [Luteimonas fraxinea]MCD9126367.1 DUF1275 domain-containing protein [Luteimonas fraxinea]
MPRIAWVGTALLAFTAGMVNVVGYLGFEHQALSHLTGTASLQSIAIANQEWGVAGILLAVMASFFGGAFLGGLVLKDKALSEAYVLTLGIEGVLLLLASYLLTRQHGLGASLAAAACGLQNAMTSFYSGSAIRSTHLTGFFTDLGLVVGQTVRGDRLPRKRFSLMLLVLGTFSLGGILAAKLFQVMGFAALTVPSLVVFGAALGLAAHQRQRRDPADS